MRAIQRTINEKYLISPSLTFFLIHSIQIGVGILSFQRIVGKSAGNDSWIPVILAGVIVHIFIWIIYKILKYGKGDLITIHFDYFGKWTGGVLSIVWIIYFATVGMTVLRNYIEIIQVWMFPDISVILFSSFFLLLVYYLIIGGFRIVTGICFIGVLIPSYLFLTFFYPLEYAEIRHLLPVWNHTLKDIVISTKNMMLSYLGFSTILMFYPYIKHPERSMKWAFLGNFTTLMLYTFLIIISILYFGEGYLSINIWPSLTMWKIVELPFVERFEYIGISSWSLIILPNICLAFWASSRGMRQLFKFSQRKALIGIMLITIVINHFLKEREHIEIFNTYVSYIGIVLCALYLPFLLTVIFIINWRKKND